jgi:hypothetical protein
MDEITLFCARFLSLLQQNEFGGFDRLAVRKLQTHYRTVTQDYCIYGAYLAVVIVSPENIDICRHTPRCRYIHLLEEIDSPYKCRFQPGIEGILPQNFKRKI